MALERGLLPDDETLKQLTGERDSLVGGQPVESLRWPAEPLRMVLIRTRPPQPIHSGFRCLLFHERVKEQCSLHCSHPCSRPARDWIGLSSCKLRCPGKALHIGMKMCAFSAFFCFSVMPGIGSWIAESGPPLSPHSPQSPLSPYLSLC